MNEILTYAASNRRSVDISYELPDGKKVKVAKKLQGSETDTIREMVEDLKAKGVKSILIDVFKPNGSTMRFDRTFIQGEPMATLGNALQNVAARHQQQQPQQNMQQQQQQSMESWKDYALSAEREKNAKLEKENIRLSGENRNLDSKVREFEKEMIKKDFELQGVTMQMESKSGLSGFMEKAAENPAMMGVISTVLGRVIGADITGGSPALMGADTTAPKTKSDQYAENVKNWLSAQSEPVQDAFYSMVFALTNLPDVHAAIQRISNTLRKPAPSSLSDEVKLSSM